MPSGSDDFRSEALVPPWALGHCAMPVAGAQPSRAACRAPHGLRGRADGLVAHSMVLAAYYITPRTAGDVGIHGPTAAAAQLGGQKMGQSVLLWRCGVT